MSRVPVTRRQALARLGSLVASSPLLRGQQRVEEPPGRITPREEAVNVFDV